MKTCTHFHYHLYCSHYSPLMVMKQELVQPELNCLLDPGDGEDTGWLLLAIFCRSGSNKAACCGVSDSPASIAHIIYIDSC